MSRRFRFSDQWVRSVLESTCCAVVCADTRGRIVFWNGHAESMLGYRKGELQGKSLTVLIPERFRPSHQDGFERAVAGAQLKSPGSASGLTALRKDGTEIPIEMTLIRDKRGAQATFTAILCDLTRQERREQEIVRLKTAAETSGEVIFLTDLEGIITYLNPEFTKVYGYTAEEVIGRHTPRILKSGLIPPENYRQFWNSLLNREVVRGEYVNRAKDGRLIPVEGSASPVLDDRGNLVGFLGIQRDVTERKKTEELNRAIIHGTMDGFWIVDLDGRILEVSEEYCRLTGYSREEMLRMRIPDIEAIEKPEEVAGHIRKILESGHDRFETRHRRKDGKLLDIEVNVHALEGDGGRMFAFLRNITEHKRLETQYLQAQKMEVIGRLAGGVAHDFNNLLTVINGYGGLLLGKMKPGDPHRAEIEEIRKAGQRAASLTRQLLLFSRNQAGASTTLDLNAVVSGTEKLLRRLMGEDVEISIRLERSPAVVRGDPGQIEQILMNLAVNARDAMPDGGTLFVEVSNIEVDGPYARRHASLRPGPYALLSVGDTGCGMNAEVQSHLFEPFFTTKEAGKGTGLGLATVYGIVKQAGGDVSVYSKPGRGSVFRIYFPRIAPAAGAAPAPESTGGTLRGNETILLAEDEEALRDLAGRILQGHGYTVLAAGNGIEALEIADRRSGPIHLLISDVVMPRMGGYELARRLEERRPRTKVLYVSGYTTQQLLPATALTGGAGFLQKPFSEEALARKVRELLDVTTTTP